MSCVGSGRDGRVLPATLSWHWGLGLGHQQALAKWVHHGGRHAGSKRCGCAERGARGGPHLQAGHGHPTPRRHARPLGKVSQGGCIGAWQGSAGPTAYPLHPAVGLAEGQGQRGARLLGEQKCNHTCPTPSTVGQQAADEASSAQGVGGDSCPQRKGLGEVCHLANPCSLGTGELRGPEALR